MATQIPVTVRRDHLEQLAQSARPLEALCELVWNAFDADARRVEVSFGLNALGAVESIRVMDDGSGVFHAHAASLFGNLGESWKKDRRVGGAGRQLHGRKGRGRFKAFALGARVEWTTTCHTEHGGGLIDYSIKGDFAKMDQFLVESPTPSTSQQTGTWVILQNLHKDYATLLGEKGRLAMAEQFGAYLEAYPGTELIYDGKPVTPAMAQVSKREQAVSVTLPDQGTQTFRLRFVEWTSTTERYIHLCDEAGSVLHSVKPGAGIRAKGLDFTAYVASPLLASLAGDGRLTLEEIDPVVGAILEVSRATVRELLQAREAKQAENLVAKLTQEGVYPFAEPSEQAGVKLALFDEALRVLHRQVPQVESLNHDGKRLVYALLGRLVQDHPEQVSELFETKLGLDKKVRERLVKLALG